MYIDDLDTIVTFGKYAGKKLRECPEEIRDKWLEILYQDASNPIHDRVAMALIRLNNRHSVTSVLKNYGYSLVVPVQNPIIKLDRPVNTDPVLFGYYVELLVKYISDFNMLSICEDLAERLHIDLSQPIRTEGPWELLNEFLKFYRSMGGRASGIGHEPYDGELRSSEQGELRSSEQGELRSSEQGELRSSEQRVPGWREDARRADEERRAGPATWSTDVGSGEKLRLPLSWQDNMNIVMLACVTMLGFGSSIRIHNKFHNSWRSIAYHSDRDSLEILNQKLSVIKNTLMAPFHGIDQMNANISVGALIGVIDIIGTDELVDIKCCQVDDPEKWYKQLHIYACMYYLRHGIVMKRGRIWNFLKGTEFVFKFPEITEKLAKEIISQLVDLQEHRDLFV